MLCKLVSQNALGLAYTATMGSPACTAAPCNPFWISSEITAEHWSSEISSENPVLPAKHTGLELRTSDESVINTVVEW